MLTVKIKDRGKTKVGFRYYLTGHRYRLTIHVCQMLIYDRYSDDKNDLESLGDAFQTVYEL